MVRLVRTSVVGLALAGLVGACSSSWDWDGWPSDDDGNGGPPPAGSGGGTAGPLPPENEIDETYRAPVVTGRFLWSANPESNRVALIDAQSLQIRVFDGGHAPTYLAALPAGATKGGALVLNQLSRDASVFLLDPEAEGGPALDVERVPVQAGASAWTVGATGRVALAWSLSTEGLLGPNDGYQDVTAFELGEEITGTRLSVGPRPRRVVVSDDESRAVVVSELGLSLISWGEEGPAVEREIFLPDAAPGAQEVSITPDGEWALLRTEGESTVLLVNVDTDERHEVSLPAPVTDLDLSSSGNLAVAVLRAPSEGSGTPISRVALLPLPEIFSDPSAFEILEVEGVLGSAALSPDGRMALLYTTTGSPNATSSSTRIVALDLVEHTTRTIDVRASVQAAVLSEDGQYAVVLLYPPPGSTKQGAFALVPLTRSLPARIEGTDSIPRFVAFAPDGSAALVATQGQGSAPSSAYLIQLPDLRVDVVPLPSEPLAAGIVPEANRAFVSQRHPEGRISFIELDSGRAMTVTGFELASKVVDR